MTLEEFHERWLKVHGPLVQRLREKLPMMKRYVQSHTISGPMNDGLREGRGTMEGYDGITEVWFDSLEAMASQGEDALAASQALFEDEAKFLDFSTSCVFITQEHEIF